MQRSLKTGMCGVVRVAVVTAFLGMISPQFACAVVIAYEPFNYPVGGPVLGGNGGFGFTGPWATPRPVGGGNTPPGSNIVVAGSLPSPIGLPSTGNHALFTGGFGTLDALFRSFPEISGAAGTTTWFSFLGQRVGERTDAPNSLWPNNPYPRSGNLSFFDSQRLANPVRGERISIGNSSGTVTGDPNHYDEWSIMPEGFPQYREGPPDHTPSQGELVWAVVRIDHVGDHTVGDSAWLWLNPDPLGGEPIKANADVVIISGDANALDFSSLDFVRPFAGGADGSGPGFRPAAALLIDEIRIGTTWNDMRAVPEPAGAILMLLGAIALRVPRKTRRYQNDHDCTPTQ